jgi:DNA-binding NtrC family response regulator
VSGAFTGAEACRGLIEKADLGTIMFDEIGAISCEVQAKLLQFLDDRHVRRVGSTRSRPIDTWVIVATNEDLEVRVREGTFRADLYHRLQSFTVHIPPLTSRREDIALLAEHFVRQAAHANERSDLLLAPDLLLALEGRSWPGNARELKAVIDRLVILSGGPILTAADLRQRINGELPAVDSDHLDLDRILDRCLREILLMARDQGRGNVAQMATLLGKSPASVYRYLRRHGIEARDEDPRAPSKVQSRR